MKEGVKVDIFQKCTDFEAARVARADGSYPYFIPLDRNEGTEVVYQGKRIIMCGSNNYLGLTTHPKVREAAVEAIKKNTARAVRGGPVFEREYDHHRGAGRKLADWSVRKPRWSFRPVCR